MSKNRAASIRARLKNRSDAAKQDFNLTLTHYGLERLLYRLSVSRHAPNFLLKGALLFKLWYDVPQRPTRDADLLGFGADDMDSVADVRSIDGKRDGKCSVRAKNPYMAQLLTEAVGHRAGCGL